MKILCLVCEHAGHLDFGGGGFLSLAATLTARGHTLHWLAPEANANRLKEHGFKAATSSEAGNLYLVPILSADRITQRANEFNKKLNAIQSLIKTAQKYDLIMCDRLLALGSVLASKVNKPIVIVGTPATHFQLTQQFPVEIANPVDDYINVGKAFAKKIGCNVNAISSFWALSPQLNICFTAKNFYQFANPEHSAFIHHFEDDDSVTTKSPKTIGFSFGNTGQPHLLLQLIQAFATQAPAHLKIQVYAGRDIELLVNAREKLPSNVEVMGWINFRETFKTLTALVCYGGIGTLWEAANCAIPVATLPDIGDQLINSLAIERLQLGYMLDAKDVASQANIDKLNALLQNPVFRQNALDYKSKSNFSDNLDSACVKIENLVNT